MKTGFVLAALVVLFLTAGHNSAAQAAEKQILTFGVVPQQSAFTTIDMWKPLLDLLGKKTGYTIQFVPAKDIPTFTAQLAAGAYDLAYMNPYHYTVYHKKPGYVAIAKQENAQLKSIIVVRKDATYKKLKELNNQTVAFPAPSAFAATIIPLNILSKQGIKVTPKYVTSHSSSYYYVAQGITPAAGGVLSTFDTLPDDIKNQLRILWISKNYTPHAIAAHPRLSREVLDKISKAFLSLDDDAEGRAALGSINFKGITAAKDGDWDDIRALNIKGLDNRPKH